jgi:hypothetical protein
MTTTETPTTSPALADLVKVGDFFSCSWGYDQTNVDFYEVVGLTAKSVKLIPAASAQVDDQGHGITHVAPLAGTRPAYASHLPIDKPSTKRARIWWDRYEGRFTVSVRMASYASASLWNCKPKYETGAGWGH